MKQLHTFNEVLDSQRIFRLLLEAEANPGTCQEIKEQSGKLFGKDPDMLALAMTLLDGSVSFCAWKNRELSEQILLLTHARETELERADYIFAAVSEDMEEIMEGAKEGTLENPHTSAVLILKISEDEMKKQVILRGPGVDGEMKTEVPEAILYTVKLRDRQEYEYPQGVDCIFILPESRIFCIPRLVRMEEC